MLGENMAKEWAKWFYKSKAWLQCRTAFIAYRISIDGGMCEHCQTELGYICDHIDELTPDNINNPDITLNHDNLQYLCTLCHNKKTFSTSEVLAEGLEFDEHGDLMQTPPIK